MSISWGLSVATEPQCGLTDMAAEAAQVVEVAIATQVFQDRQVFSSPQSAHRSLPPASWYCDGKVRGKADSETGVSASICWCCFLPPTFSIFLGLAPLQCPLQFAKE